MRISNTQRLSVGGNQLFLYYPNGVEQGKREGKANRGRGLVVVFGVAKLCVVTVSCKRRRKFFSKGGETK